MTASRQTSRQQPRRPGAMASGDRAISPAAIPRVTRLARTRSTQEALISGAETCDSPGVALSDTPLSSPVASHGAVIARTRDDSASGRLVAGRYRVQHLLGRGGMGAVWLARDELLRRPIAIKELRLPETVTDSTFASSSLLREAQAASQISHPGVVSVYDVAVEDGRSWMVMEALGGQNLAQAIRQQGRLPVAQVVDIAVQLLEALQAVHREGIIHRDVKPSNVQICAASRVVLTDFGLAAGCDVEPADEAGHVFGSPPYMAPEAIREGRIGPASDLFSLGATLYAAVEGRQPFQDLTPFSTLVTVMHEPPAPALHAGCLGPVIEGLLTKDPDQRLGLHQASLWLKAVEFELRTAGSVSGLVA